MTQLCQCSPSLVLLKPNQLCPWPYPWAKNMLSEKRKKNMSCPVFFYLALGGEIWLYKSRRIWRAECCWDGVMHWGHPPGDSDILWSSLQLRRGRCMTNGTANQETYVIHHASTPWHGPSGSTCSEGAAGSSQAWSRLSRPSRAADRQFNLSNVPKRHGGSQVLACGSVKACRIVWILKRTKRWKECMLWIICFIGGLWHENLTRPLEHPSHGDIPCEAWYVT